MSNKVFIGTSLDGYISDRNNDLSFLELVPNPGGSDLGFDSFIDSIDAILMGRKTYEKVLSFGIAWPYSKPVFVLSSTSKKVPENLIGKVEMISGPITNVVEELRKRNFKDLYIDGGKLIQSFLAEDMIDELIVTQVPILLGGGSPLYGSMPHHLEMTLVKSEVLLDGLVQSHYKRMR